MSDKITIYVKVKKKQYPVQILLLEKGKVHVECEAAWIDQEFEFEDLAGLLLDLPQDIIDVQSREKNRNVVRFRVTTQEKCEMEKLAISKGYKSLSAFLRDLVKNA